MIIRGCNVKTPNIAIVLNPNKLIVKPNELEKFGAELIITNSYIINNSIGLRKEAIEKGLHKMLGWERPVYTDSGTYQAYSQNIVGINPEDIVKFENIIGSDIITPLDVFTRPDEKKAEAKRKLATTIERIRAARKEITQKLLVGPVQGGAFLDLRRLAARKVAEANPDIFAIGGIVPYMTSYRYKELCDVIIACKQNLPPNKPVHAFGAGHPMVFALLSAIGCDIFDSAMYSLAAKRNAYLTVDCTHDLNVLNEFPCSCEVCTNHTPKELREMPAQKREELLARHNLHATFQELRTVRQAMSENWLWELVQMRARSHPALLEATQHVLKTYGKWLVKQEPVSKRSALQWLGEESKYRPEILRAREWMKRVKGAGFTKAPFGRVPLGLKSVYPFGQSLIPGQPEGGKRAAPEVILKHTLEYQYGRGAARRFAKSSVEVSRKTGRPKHVFNGRGEGRILLGTFRAHDGFFLSTVEGAKLIKSIPKVYIDEDVAEFAKQGKSVFAKFVKSPDKFFPGEEVAVCSKEGIVAVGRAILSSEETKFFKYGVAIAPRAKA